MKKVIKASNARRKAFIKWIDEIWDELHRTHSTNLLNRAENILVKYGGSRDEIDSEEGFYATMSDEGIEEAYEEISNLVKDSMMEDYRGVEEILDRAGFVEKQVENQYGIANYYVWGGVGVVIASEDEARELAKIILERSV